MSLDRAQLDDVKRTLSDPVDVAHRLGLRGTREGAGFKVVCPSHGDRGPSLSLTRGPDGTLRIRCFGCPLAGDVFDLVAAVRGLDRRANFPEVLKLAAELAAIQLEDRPARSPSPAPVPAGPTALPDDVFASLVAPLLWTGCLDDSATAGDVTCYLEGRGLLEEAQREGWAALPPPEFQHAVIRQMRDTHGDDVVARSGLVHVPAGGEPDWRRFLHADARLIIPWRDPSGLVYTLQRRRLDDGKPKYVAATGRSPRWPYGVHWIAARSGAVAVVEGAIDALALKVLLERRGVDVVPLGIQGVQGWRSSWATLARDRDAFVAFDADAAGEKAVAIVARDLAEQGARKVARMAPTTGKDWAEALEAA